jgi:hypothetical protein
MHDPEKPRITIAVSGGMVQSAYTTPKTEAEADVLDADDNGGVPIMNARILTRIFPEPRQKNILSIKGKREGHTILSPPFPGTSQRSRLRFYFY